MTVAIHQPEFLPWLGFFHKMALADVYVVLDHVQFKKRYFENRNRIVGPDGKPRWLCVPVISKGLYDQAINQVRIDSSRTWKRKFLETLRHAFHACAHFEPLFSRVSEVVENFTGRRLIDLNMAFILLLRDELGIDTPMILSSEIFDGSLRSAPEGSDLILELCLRAHADRYLSGPFGRRYLDLERFEDRGVEVKWLEYEHPSYGQIHPGFTSHLSTLDLLFNHGPRSREILMGPK